LTVALAALGLIDRGDLVAALDRAATRKVTIISAPPGSGKTSLLRSWADRPGQPRQLAVVRMQRDQQDAQQFWLALLDAVRHVSGASSGAERPAATPDFNAPAMVDRVLSELADARSGITLVIEDLHELTSPEALAQLTRLLTNLPPRVHGILTTRPDVRLRLHQLRLAGELAEIRAADLRFSERETRDLLDASGITLSAAGAALLHQRTEGWAAGLRLAAISLAGHPEPERFVTEFSGSDRTVAEYLLAEMLDRQPPDVQDLLLRTSLLDRVNGELADVLTGRPGSERILLDLEDANAFVESLDPERAWFRYHHLLADFLRLELRRTLPDQVPVLHRRAAEWYIRQGLVVEAIRHTQAAGDWPQAARLDDVAPERMTVPSGSQIRIDYSDPTAPVLPVKIQETFGWQRAPTLADGRVTLVLHLLSPAGRPAAVTSDLPSFWRNTYPEVRKELRARYPRHPWPEDPTTAPPTRRTQRS